MKDLTLIPFSGIDAAFADLRIWKDADGDAVTDEGELLTLAQAGVQSISVGGGGVADTGYNEGTNDTDYRHAA